MILRDEIRKREELEMRLREETEKREELVDTQVRLREKVRTQQVCVQ